MNESNDKYIIYKIKKMLYDVVSANQDKGLLLIEEALIIYNRLIMKQQSYKIQLDKVEGQQIFKEFVNKIEQIMQEIKVQYNPRQFRTNYTNAYKVLYQDYSLGYIPEIYDSAQESFPFIYVNGQKFDFSSEVLILGQKLVQSLFRMIHEFRFASLRGQSWQCNIKICLQQFDTCWISYEQKYINQLIIIENHSKSAIKNIIKTQQKLHDYEKQQKLKGKIFISGLQYDHLRKNLCEKICKLNSVANLNGKGRDDLSFQILSASQNVLNTVTDFQSKSVRLLAQKIRQTYQNVRYVLKFFGQNFQMVDPQLKNNPQLVSALQQYQFYWQKGKRYFLQPKKQNQIVAFSTIVQAAKEKYSIFKQLIQYSDPSIFWIIPSLIILRSLQDQDEGLAESFLGGPVMKPKYQQYLTLKQLYLKEKQKISDNFSLYNKLEHLLIYQQTKEQKHEITTFLNKIKQLAVSLQRVSPMDWNDMLGVLLLESQ